MFSAAQPTGSGPTSSGGHIGLRQRTTPRAKKSPANIIAQLPRKRSIPTRAVSPRRARGAAGRGGRRGHRRLTRAPAPPRGTSRASGQHLRPGQSSRAPAAPGPRGWRARADRAHDGDGGRSCGSAAAREWTTPACPPARGWPRPSRPGRCSGRSSRRRGAGRRRARTPRSWCSGSAAGGAGGTGTGTGRTGAGAGPQ